MDGTYNQVRPLDRLKGSDQVFSYDLKSATDRWPLILQSALANSMFGRRFGRYIHDVFSLSLFEVPFVKSLRGPIRFETGQPLGYLSSIVL
ncbi:hypothetical protein L6164_037815 [Bauhinia variegata]|uniref:Uncharacterized protein n=1 Tax=Bauhinia variegata TaxID=167791 RepID=A0ACB9KLE6_BAUVA|nr:hypothetical protein L6164_037815 [Bauhinia variegata]